VALKAIQVLKEQTVQMALQAQVDLVELAALEVLQLVIKVQVE
jgi:hypothetical protein